MSQSPDSIRFTVEIPKSDDEWLKRRFPGTSKWWIIRQLIAEFRQATEQIDHTYIDDMKHAALELDAKIRNGDFS